MRKLAAGNWKMNGTADSLTEIAALAAATKGAACDILICPPATLIAQMAATAKGTDVMVGGQDCHAKVSGAHTGDISAAMLRDAGAGHVILGHSERRADHGETDADVRAKAEAAGAAGLIRVICVGETEAERDAGTTLAIIGRQLAGSIPDGATAADTVIAYEPVWAIGTGKTASPQDVKDMHGFIRSRLKEKLADSENLRILYGGSMKPENAGELLATENVDGGLIGGASLESDPFLEIVGAVK